MLKNQKPQMRRDFLNSTIAHIHTVDKINFILNYAKYLLCERKHENFKIRVTV